MLNGTISSNTLVAVIFRKLGRLSPSTNKQINQGQITNFIQVDVMSLYHLCISLPLLVSLPLLLIFAFSFLSYYLGIAFLAAIAVFITAFLSNAMVGKKLSNVNKMKMKKKDARMNAVTESLTNIKILKFYSL